MVFDERKRRIRDGRKWNGWFYARLNHLVWRFMPATALAAADRPQPLVNFCGMDPSPKSKHPRQLKE